MDACTADTGGTLGREYPASKRPVEGGISDAQLYDLIVTHFGVLAHIAIAMGIARAALDRRIKRTIELQAAVNGARRVLVRVAQAHLQQALSVGASWADMFQAGRLDREAVAATGARKPRVPQTRDAVREPRLAVAEAATRKLAFALHFGEPAAVMYCLSHLGLGHLQPGGPYEKHRREIPEEMFVEVPAEMPVDQMPVDQMPAPTVGLEVTDASTAKEVSAVESVQVHAESAPTLVAEVAPTVDAAVAPTVNDGSGQFLEKEALAEPVAHSPVEYRRACALPLQLAARRKPTGECGIRHLQNLASPGAAVAPTLSAKAASLRQVCAIPGRDCRANHKCRQTRLVCCAPLHTPYLPRQPSCLCLVDKPCATLMVGQRGGDPPKYQRPPPH